MNVVTYAWVKPGNEAFTSTRLPSELFIEKLKAEGWTFYQTIIEVPVEAADMPMLPTSLIKRRNFRESLQVLINYHSMETGSNTPDFILAKYLDGVLAAFDVATRERDKWHGVEPVSSHVSDGSG